MTQFNLHSLTREGEPVITIERLQDANTFCTFLNNDDIGNRIDSISSKVVLILGSFVPERKAVLDAIKLRLRHLNYIPLMFDFAKPDNRNEKEAVLLLETF